MFLHGNSRVINGELYIGGCSTTELTRAFGTPLIVYDEQHIRDLARAYRRPFEQASVPYAIAYASKAFSSIAMCQLAQEEGLWLDVVSGGELYTALSAGFPPEHIYMHGNNKTIDELEYAVDHHIGMIVIDNFHEIEELSRVLQKRDQKIDVILRVSPGVDAHTHEFISTGQQDSKFGFDLYSGQVEIAVGRVLEHPNLRLVGLHSHIGSQIFDVAGFRVAASRMATLFARLKREYGLELSILNLGGGVGIRYTGDDILPPLEVTVKGIIEVTQHAFKEQHQTLPILMLEPGRSLVGTSGTTLYTVGSRKDIAGIRSYLAVDGGMTDNPRLALYGAKYEAAIANRMDEPNAQTVSIAGKCCESGDMLIWDAVLPASQPADILAVSCTGAYNYSMASNYNRIPRPAVVFVQGGDARLVIRRETWDDVVRLDVPVTVRA